MFTTREVEVARFQPFIKSIQKIKALEILNLVLMVKALNILPVSFVQPIKHFASAVASFEITVTKCIITIKFTFELISQYSFQFKTILTSCQSKELMSLFPRAS
jgi:hypothetical protein